MEVRHWVVDSTSIIIELLLGNGSHACRRNNPIFPFRNIEAWGLPNTGGWKVGDSEVMDVKA